MGELLLVRSYIEVCCVPHADDQPSLSSVSANIVERVRVRGGTRSGDLPRFAIVHVANQLAKSIA